MIKQFVLTPNGATELKSVGNGRSPLFNLFMGIQNGVQKFTQSDQGYAEAYQSSILMWRCINVVANTFAGLPLIFETSDGDALPSTHPAVRYLGDKRGRLWRATAKDMQIFGKAFWLPERRAPMRLNPMTVEGYYDVTGIVEFIQRLEGRVVGRWSPNELVYFFDYNPQHDLAGLSPTALALREIETELTLEQFIGEFFDNGAFLSGILTTDQAVQDVDADRIQSRWRKVLRGVRNAGKVAFLDRGTTFNPITPPLKDLDMSAMDERNARKICQAYGVPLTMALATDAANYATSKEQRQSFYTETVLPFADIILEEVNLQLMPDFGDVVVRVNKAEIEVLQEDLTEITQRAAQAYGAGYMTINEARAMEGLPELDVDVLLMNGQAVTVAQINQGQLPAPAPASPFGLSAPALPAPDTDKALGQSFAVLLHIGAHPELVQLQKQLRGQVEALEWNDPDDFHVTLIMAPDVDAGTLDALLDAVSAVPVPGELKLNVGSLHTFDTLGSHALHFRIRRNTALLDYQAALVDAAHDCGVTLSQHSEPSQYKPHITMATLANRLPATTYRTRLTVTPESVQATYEQAEDEYAVLWEQRLAAKAIILTPPTHALALRDLKNWKRKAETKGRTAPFTSAFIPSARAAFVRMDLDAGRDVRETFDAALRALDEPDAELPTPEEFEAYWRDIEALYSDFVEAFGQSFDDLQAELAKQAGRGGDIDLSALALSDEIEGRLADVLAQIRLGGMARGQELLPSGSNLAIDWDVVNDDAVVWAREHAAELVRGINDTSREIIGDKIAAWIDGGGTRDDLAQALAGDLAGLNVPSGWSAGKLQWATSPERAALIAQTETTNAFNRGVEERWMRAGITKFKWRTQNDGLVCDLCRALNGRIGEIGKGVTYQGKDYEPAAHPGCRCFEAPEE